MADHTPDYIEGAHRLHRLAGTEPWPRATGPSRSWIRHDNGPVPADYSARQERGRWIVCWAIALASFALMLAHMAGVGL